MAKATMYLFTSMTCPNCPPAKQLAHDVAKERDDVVLKNVVSGMAGSNGLFKKFDVMAVPTIIIKGPGYDKNIGLRGVQPAKTLHKYIDMALGIQPEEQPTGKSGFLSKLKRVFANLDD